MTGREYHYALRAWLAIWRFWQGYFHYTVEGLETLADSSMPASVVAGYHGRPIAFDMCILQTLLYEKLGYLPAGILHVGVASVAPARWLFLEQLGFFAGNDEAGIDEWIRGKHHLFVTPGGEREALRTGFDDDRVDWGDRSGYLKIAIRNGVPVVPVAAGGVDQAYFGLTNAYDLGASMGVHKHLRWLLWGGVGMMGLYPFAPPFPVRIHQKIGSPIAVDDVDPNDPAQLAARHRQVQDEVQRLLNEAREVLIKERVDE